MFKKTIVLSALAATILLTGCAHEVVPMESSETETLTKTFPAPPSGMAGLYIYRRNNLFGRVDLPLKVILDGDFVGNTLQNVYFYRVISPGNHRIDTQTTVGQAAPVIFKAEAGHTYFVKQDPNVTNYGVFGGTSIKMVDSDEGKKEVLECDQAK
jgi:hypothetical protein